jgi:hypothetical protein
MVLPSLNVVIIANIFVIVVVANNAAERSVVAFLSISIAVAITRQLQRRKYSPVNMEGTDFADIPPPNLGACHNVSKG